jgi:DNA-binding NarL/FixJ family response regulator
MGTTVLIVDDHSDFRTWARVMLEEGGYTVVSEAADGASAFDAARRLRPEVVLLDVQLPGMDGFEVARRLGAEQWSPAIVLTSTRDASEYGDRLARSSVLGFLAKDELSAQSLAGVLGIRGDRRRS